MGEYIQGTTIEQATQNTGRRTKSKTLVLLNYHEALAYDMTNGQYTFMDLLNIGSERGISAKATYRQTGFSPSYLSELYRSSGIHILTHDEAVRANLQDLGYRERNAAGTRAKWQDPKFRRKNAEGVRAMLYERWQDPKFKERQAAGTRAKWQDPKFREERSDAMKANMQDLKFREKTAAGVSANWRSPVFRERQAAGTRAARLRKENQGRYTLPTIQGQRADTGYAHSAMEANIARIFINFRRKYIMHQPLKLRDGSAMEIDFVVDKRGITVCYEIMAHPFKDPEGWDRLLRARSEYPDLHIRPITGRSYRRLERRFRDRIDSDPALCGWETRESNLRNSPARFS